MTNERSDSHEKKAKASDVAADGWPAWMGPATPSLAPKPAPKPVVARASAAPVKRVAAVPRAVAPEQPDSDPAPAAAPEQPVPRRWLRSLCGAFAVVLALVAGDMAARAYPEAAIKFQHAVGNVLGRLPASVTSAALWRAAGGVAFVLCAVLVWQAGRTRRPLFLPIALFLCAMSAGFGLFRGGHDVDVQRSAAKLEQWRKAATEQLADKARALEGLEAKLREAQADRDQLQKSSVLSQATLQEKDAALEALRKEIEELRRKLAEKKD